MNKYIRGLKRYRRASLGTAIVKIDRRFIIKAVRVTRLDAKVSSNVLSCDNYNNRFYLVNVKFAENSYLPFIEDLSLWRIIGVNNSANWTMKIQTEMQRTDQEGRIFTENFNPSQMRSCIYTFRCESQSACICVVVDIERNCIVGIVEIRVSCTCERRR